MSNADLQQLFTSDKLLRHSELGTNLEQVVLYLTNTTPSGLMEALRKTTSAGNMDRQYRSLE
jgi:hypothetical protein